MNKGHEASDAQSVWLSSARLMPSPHTAAQKAALAAQLQTLPAKKAFTNTRVAVGTAAVAVAVAIPSLSLEAMVNTVGGPLFNNDLIEPEERESASGQLSAEIWTPSSGSTQTVYAQIMAIEEPASTFTSRPTLSAFDRELPLSVLETGSQEFDLAFAGVEMPSLAAAVVPRGVPGDRQPISQTSASAIATRTISIEQITDLDLVVRATPENVRSEQTSLALNSTSARTDAIANRSVEAAFAGAIDASSAVRSSLPIAPTRAPSQVRAPSAPSVNEAPQAISVGAPPPDVSAAAAAQAALVSKTKLDARVNGVLTGSVDFRQLDGTIAIRLRSVANLMREQFSKTEFASIVGGRAIDTYVPLAQLQAAGIPVSYSPAYDEVEFGIDYQDAPNAKKVHVDQISVAPIGPELTAIEQIPR